MAKIGQNRIRFAIQTPPAGTRNAHGEKSGDWTTVAHRWGGWEPFGGREQIQAKIAQVTSSGRVKFHERYRDLTTKMRLVGGGMTLQIDNISDRPWAGEQEMQCTGVS